MTEWSDNESLKSLMLSSMDEEYTQYIPLLETSVSSLKFPGKSCSQNKNKQTKTHQIHLLLRASFLYLLMEIFFSHILLINITGTKQVKSQLGSSGMSGICVPLAQESIWSRGHLASAVAYQGEYVLRLVAIGCVLQLLTSATIAQEPQTTCRHLGPATLQ